MKSIVIVAALLLPWILLPAQEKMEIEIGKTFAYRDNEALNNMLDSERGGRARKVILDLFSSSCPVCFSMMPTLQKLQDQFGDHIRILLVGKKDRDIEKLFNRFRTKFSLSLDVVYDSGFFAGYNTHFLPRYIWLDEKGIVVAATGTEEVSEEGVSRFIAGEIFEVHRRKLDPATPFILGGTHNADTGLLYRSGLSRWNNEVPFLPHQLRYSKHGSFFQAIGATADDLYRYAYFGRAYWTHLDAAYRTVFKTPLRVGKDTGSTDGMRFNYAFMHEGAGDSLLLQRALQNDLSTYFGYQARIIHMKVPCWKLVLLPGAKERLRSTHRQKKYNGSYTFIDYRGVSSFDVLELLLTSREDDYPLIDATGIDFPVDITMHANLYDRAETVAALRLAGLDLVSGEIRMQVLLLEKN